MRDSFGYGEKPGDVMKTLPGEDADAMTRLQKGEEEEELRLSEFCVGSCSKDSMLSDICSPEPLQSDESPLLSPPFESPTTSNSLAPLGEDSVRRFKFECYCGREFQKREGLT